MLWKSLDVETFTTVISGKTNDYDPCSTITAATITIVCAVRPANFPALIIISVFGKPPYYQEELTFH